MKRCILLVGFLGIGLLFVTGGAYGRIQKAIREAQFTDYPKTKPLTSKDKALINEHCPFGKPNKMEEIWKHGPTHLVVRDGYVLEHSSIDRIPLWVCELVTSEQLKLTSTVKRKNRFLPDPELPEGERAELADYRWSGCDRGHQAPAGNQNQDQRLKDETFYLSNMAPQKGPFNQIIWRELENLTRSWVKKRGKAYIITGGFFYDPQEDKSSEEWNDGRDADGIVNYKVIGKNMVAVPSHFYKIVVSQNEEGEWEAIAFVMENRKYKNPYLFDNHIKSIDWIEERTGLDFMPDLDEQREKKLEAKAPSKIW